eukprot:UN33007
MGGPIGDNSECILEEQTNPNVQQQEKEEEIEDEKKDDDVIPDIPVSTLENKKKSPPKKKVRLFKNSIKDEDLIMKHQKGENKTGDVFRCLCEYVVEIYYEDIFLYFGTFEDGKFIANELNKYFQSNQKQVDENVMNNLLLCKYLNLNQNLGFMKFMWVPV